MVKALGLIDDDVLWVKPMDWLRFRAVVIPATPGRVYEKITPRAMDSWRRLINLAPLRQPSADAHYIVQRGAGVGEGRELVNWMELRTALGDDFGVLKFETLALREKWEVLSQSRTLVMEWGSAIANLLLAQASGMKVAMLLCPGNEAKERQGFIDELITRLGHEVLYVSGDYTDDLRLNLRPENFDDYKWALADPTDAAHRIRQFASVGPKPTPLPSSRRVLLQKDAYHTRSQQGDQSQQNSDIVRGKSFIKRPGKVLAP